MARIWTEEQKEERRIMMLDKIAKREAEKKNFLQKVESFNGEEVPEVEVSNMSTWSERDMFDSVVNTIKILPANMLLNGRHRIENIQAINCFKVTETLLDAVYSKYKHDEFGQVEAIVE
jgi:hypothetical protein